MDNKNIICYCSGGIGNRLRPLTSCYTISKLTNRKLVIYWDNVKPENYPSKFNLYCEAIFNDLFKNELEIISKEDLSLLEDCANYVDEYLAEAEANRFKPELKILGTKFGYLGLDNIELNTKNKNMIFYSNNFARCTNDKEFLSLLKPIDSIQNNIDRITEQLHLNKSIIGIHARGTDFHCPVSFYIEKIERIYNQNNNQKFFLCSDDLEYERIITQKYPNNVLTRKKDNYPQQRNGQSLIISKQEAQDGLEDMYLLSKTNIQVYNPESTFAEIAILLGKN